MGIQLVPSATDLVTPHESRRGRLGLMLAVGGLVTLVVFAAGVAATSSESDASATEGEPEAILDPETPPLDEPRRSPIAELEDPVDSPSASSERQGRDAAPQPTAGAEPVAAAVEEKKADLMNGYRPLFSVDGSHIRYEYFSSLGHAAIADIIGTTNCADLEFDFAFAMGAYGALYVTDAQDRATIVGIALNMGERLGCSEADLLQVR